MDTGPFFSGTFGHPGGPTLKGLAIKLGDKAQASVCYDTELLRMSCGWTGGFLKFNPARFGLISAPVIEGTAHFHTGLRPGVSPSESFVDPRLKPLYGPMPREFARYEGLSLHGQRVVLRYTIGTAKVLETPWVESSDSAFVFTREFEIGACDHPVRIVLSDAGANAELIGPSAGAVIQGTPGKNLTLLVPPPSESIRLKAAIWTAEPQQQGALQDLVKKSPTCINVSELIKPGSARWGEPLVTKGTVSDKPEPYVIDTLTIPFENRYHALMFLSGHDFFENGDAAVCTAHGDVWRVSGIDDKLERITWKRFATGLFQPLGLKIVKRDGRDLVYVLGRDQITALHDQNEDGEADFYECFNNDGHVTTNSHEFATCLETDTMGNFYYLRGDSGGQTSHDGCLLRVSPDGLKLDVFATGFRNANGLSIGPDDTITVAPQEGTWTPGSAVFQVRQGGFYGAMQSHHRAIPPTTYDPPICWLPRLQDNSSGGQAWVTSDRWGPLQGQLLHFSFGTCRMFLTLRENLDEGVQGGTVQFPLLFDSGVMRGRFRPQDGQLYVTGLKGWVSSAVQDGCFQRVRYTDKPVDMPVNMETFSNGIALTFTEELDRSTAEDPENYGVEEWNYLWSGNYGSPDFKVSMSTQVGHDEIEVRSATLLPDGRTVFLEMPLLNPAMQVGINYTLNSHSGRPVQQTFYATLHKLGTSPQPAQLTRKERPGQLPAVLEANLKPGLVLTITTDGKTNLMEQGVSRMAALYVPGQRVESVAGPAAQVGASWKGYIKIPSKGSYQFRIESRGEVRLQIGDMQIPPEQPVALRRGYQPIQLSFAGRHGEIDVRLMWKGPDTPWEAVPPSQLFFLMSDNLYFHRKARAGRDSFLQRGCGNCHTLVPKSAPIADHSVWRTPARKLTDLGHRYNAAWVAAWIQTPRLMVESSTMPRLFHKSTPAESQAIADIAKLLTESASDISDSKPVPMADADIDAGLQLYESLGCIGCHRLTDDEFNPLKPKRRSLQFVSSKYRPGEIAKFLQNPRKHAPSSRMPDFRLTTDEAKVLEAYLRSASIGKVDVLPELATADAKRGRQEFDAVGCRHCHTITETDQLLPSVAKPLKPGPQSLVCAYGGPGRNGVPAFDLSLGETLDLQLFLNLSMRPASLEFDIEQTRRQMEHFGCAACHSRDAQNSPLNELLADEGQGLPPEMLPHLTWSGEKLKADWIDRLLHGKLAYTTRPWLKARMPSFPSNQIAQGLAAEHGIQFDAPPTSPPHRPAESEIGKQLTLKGKGLDCRQCHGVGQELPSGDKSTLISVGINFSHIPERLNAEFYPRLMLNPPRYDPNSRMPVFAVDGKSTAAKGILNGDAERQFQMIWEYLRTLHP